MTIGDEPGYFDALSEFSAIMEEKTEGTVEFKYVKMESENHGTIPYLSVFSGLRFVFSDWQLPQEKLQQGLEVVDAHYTQVSSKYGYKIETPELVINALGYAHLQKNEIENAISVFTENLKRYPGSANVYDSLGEAYMVNGDNELAIKNYKKSLGINPENTNAIETLKKLESN